MEQYKQRRPTPQADALVDKLRPLIHGQAPAYVKLILDHARQVEEQRDELLEVYGRGAVRLLEEAWNMLNAQMILPEDYSDWDERYKAFKDQYYTMLKARGE